jgi:20S proteasome alpha/beta subunit
VTLIISAHGSDCVVVGSDSRGTTKHGGSRVEINMMEKIYPIGTHAAVLICGETGLATNFADILAQRVGKAKGTTRQVATALSKIAQNEALAAKGIPAHPDYFPNIGFIVAGLDVDGRKPPIPSSFILESTSAYRLGKAQNFAMDGKHLIAQYIFSRDFRVGMSIDELEYLVVGALLETMSVDGDVGGRPKLGIITKHEGWRFIIPEEVKKVERAWKDEHPHAMQ